MKTTNTTIRQIKSSISGLTFVMSFALLLTSCQKEESQQPSSANTSTESARFVDQVLPMPAFTFIKIDHLPAMSELPNYSVTVNANGTAHYEGRANVGVKRIINFELTRKQMKVINELCMSTDFFKIKDLHLNMPDLPIVSTTFANGELEKKLNDSDGVPQELVAFRAGIESALNIAKYINVGVANPTKSETK